MSTETQAAPELLKVPTECPLCGSGVWDNRTGRSKWPKKNPKAPDFKCREKGCEGAYWPPRAGQLWEDDYIQGGPPVRTGPLIPAPVRPSTVLPFDKGGPTLEQQIDQVTKSDPQATLEFSAPLYKGIVTYVMAEIVPLLEKAKSEQYSVCAADIFAASATLYIAATRNGAWQGGKT